MIISADKNKYSPPEYNVVKDIQSKYPIVLVTRLDNFVFNKDLLKLKDWIMVDMAEYEWDKPFSTTHFFGKNTNDFLYRFPGNEWTKFDEWVSKNPPLIYFKRELLKNDFSENIFPIDYPCYTDIKEPVSKIQFDSRPLSVFHFWGRSSDDRVKAHVDFWVESTKSAIAVCDNLYYIGNFINNEECKDKWMTINVPHYQRIDIKNILDFNGLSKLSLCMPGCGKKCFRHSESPTNSVMVMEESDIEFAYSWKHNVNCITYKNNDTVSAIKEALLNPNLYEIYFNGVENCRNYHVSNYNKYLEQVIKNAL